MIENLKTIRIELDEVEAAALLSMIHPTLAAIFNKEGIDKILKAVKEKDIDTLAGMSPVAQRAFMASIAVAKIEIELKKALKEESHAEEARA